MYAVAYAILWSGEDYTTQVGNISAKLLNEPSLSMASGTKLIMTVLLAVIIPSLIAVWGFTRYNKRKKARINL